MKPILFSATGDVIASEATVEDYRALLVDAFGVLAGICPRGYPGGVPVFGAQTTNAIFALIGQAPIEKRFGIRMAPKAQATVSGDS